MNTAYGLFFLGCLGAFPLHAELVFTLSPPASGLEANMPLPALLQNDLAHPTVGLSTAPAPADRTFAYKRWPCILKGAAWGKRLEKAPLPPDSLQLIAQLKETFAEEGLPGELAWVAEVESTLKTNAASVSGALGLYQFKPEAARQFGLITDNDHRTHPDKSARAAARYLTYLYPRMGDWPLTIAAYNAGEGCVRRLLKKERANTYEAIAIHLPPQTQV